jgi:probable addiction module antidote protein
MKADDLPEFDPAEYLTDDESIVAYLIEAAKDNDPAFLQSALGDVARSTIGMSALARMTGGSRESLYKALSEGGNARLDTIMKVLDALGLHFIVVPNEKAAA